MVVRSLWAAARSDWRVGLLVGWVVGRLLVCWPVVGSVVVAVLMLLVVWVLLGVAPLGKRGQKRFDRHLRSHGLSGVAFMPLVEYPFLADVTMTL